MTRLVHFSLSIIMMSATVANAATFTASFSGDVCAIPPAVSEAGESDCSFIEQAGSSKGVFALTIDNVDPNIASDAMVTILSSGADLFQSDEQIAENGGDRNNLDEYFGLRLDSLSLGVLFDGSTADEGAISTELADDVLAAIAAAEFSSDGMSLTFMLSEGLVRPLVSDGALSAIFDFSYGLTDDRYNVNAFFDPSITVEYEVREVNEVPLPASALLLIGGLGTIISLRRKKSV